ncbi:MAG: hypothetical protein Q8P62_02955, partial [Candidatus Peregrinibacteria bacterium]|nr:hypothetical protein [Candidatus Peregrinibacteria bacterium]
MHKFNLFENVINSLGKENRLCFQQASGPEATPLPLKATPDTAADLPEGATPDKAVPGAATKKTAEAGADPSAGLAAKKAEVAPPADDPYGEPAPNLSSESLLGDISADDKAAPAGDKDAPADAPAA